MADWLGCVTLRWFGIYSHVFAVTELLVVPLLLLFWKLLLKREQSVWKDGEERGSEFCETASVNRALE